MRTIGYIFLAFLTFSAQNSQTQNYNQIPDDNFEAALSKLASSKFYSFRSFQKQ